MAPLKMYANGYVMMLYTHPIWSLNRGNSEMFSLITRDCTKTLQDAEFQGYTIKKNAGSVWYPPIYWLEALFISLFESSN